MLTCIEGQSQYLNFNWCAGEDFNIPLKFLDVNGEARDLTHATIYFTLSRYLSVGDPIIAIEVTGDDHSDAEEGESNIFVPADDSKDLSGDYHVAIKVVFSDPEDEDEDGNWVVGRGKACLEANTTSQEPEDEEE